MNVIEKQSAPIPEHSYNAEDWISDVKAKGEICLIAAYDGTLALWDAVEEEILFQVKHSFQLFSLKPSTFLNFVCFSFYPKYHW